MERPRTPKGFLSNENISHDSVIFEYIVSCHEAMWELVRAIDGEHTSGNVWDHVERLTSNAND
jgi:hypothetical protein